MRYFYLNQALLNVNKPDQQNVCNTDAFSLIAQVPNTTEEDIYANSSAQRRADVAHPASLSEANSTNMPRSGPNNAEGASKSSEKKNEESNDVIYSSVIWKAKRKNREDDADTPQPGSSCLEEERCAEEGLSRSFVNIALEMGSLYAKVKPRNVEKEAETEYAQVKFKDRSAALTEK